jgi:hypothetical protein
MALSIAKKDEYEVKSVQFLNGYRMEFRETVSGEFYASTSRTGVSFRDLPDEIVKYIEKVKYDYCKERCVSNVT